MTFQEAQAKYQVIIDEIKSDSTPEELLDVQEKLTSLLDELPNEEEFDPLAEAISDASDKISGTITIAVVDDIHSRNEAFKKATEMLNEISSEAEGDASVLGLKKPKYILSSLNKSVEQVKGIISDAKGENYTDAAKKAETLIVLLKDMKSKIKSS